MHGVHLKLIYKAASQVVGSIEAVLSKATQIIPWRDLRDDSVWLQGWV
jgi:hypothetical protein